MDEELRNTYVIEPVKDNIFTKKEMKEMGVVFFKSLDDLKKALEDFGVTEVNEETRLMDFNLALTQVGTLESPSWALHYFDLMHELVCDLFENKNFYSISVKEEDKEIKIAEKAYIRNEFLEDDLLYYIDIYEENEEMNRLMSNPVVTPSMRH